MSNIKEQLSNINACKVYHKKVYMPKKLYNNIINLIKCNKKYIFSNHLKEGLNRDYKHKGTLQNILYDLEHLKLEKNIDVFEIETQFDKISKFCIRLKYDDNSDISIALKPIGNNEILVKTIWINKNEDNHKTLDYSKYEKGGKE